MNALSELLSVPLEQLLVSGGDARSAVDARTGLNSFGCTPTPRPEALSFGSSTASSISKRAFRHTQKERQKLCGQDHPDDGLDAQMACLSHELKRILGLETLETEIVFSPSGTDSVLHALFLTRAVTGDHPLDCLLPASDETGSGVALALSGRHFSTVTAEGVPVTPGTPIAGLSESVALFPLPLRDQTGRRRTSAEMDAAVADAVARSIAAGRRVLLQAMDGSKLGVRCPSRNCLRDIRSRFGEAVTIVIDACQMRISREDLRWHLAQDHLVLISGSKFFTGPPFSGALLVPAGLSQRLAAVPPVSEGLRDYTSRSAWPRAWGVLRAALPDHANFGQFFRWTAALEEMRVYFSVPLDFRRRALRQFAEIVTERLCVRSPDLVLLAEDDGRMGETDDSELSARTIFPFLLRPNGRWMPFEEVTALYQALNQDASTWLPASLSPTEKALAAKLCHIGQPVRIPMGSGQDTGALRLCASARTVSDLWQRSQASSAETPLAQKHREIETILEKIVLLSRHISMRE